RDELLPKAVAHAPHGFDAVTKTAELLAQPHHLRVHRAVEAVEVRAPEPFQQVVARERAAGMAQQKLEQVHLATRQVEVRPAEARAVRAWIEHELTERDGDRGIG